MSLDSRDPRLIPATILVAAMAAGGIGAGIEHCGSKIKEHNSCVTDPVCAAKLEAERQNEIKKIRKELDKVFNRWGKFFVR